MWPEKKSLSWMEDLLDQDSKGGQLVADQCAGTFLVARARMMLSKP